MFSKGLLKERKQGKVPRPELNGCCRTWRRIGKGEEAYVHPGNREGRSGRSEIHGRVENGYQKLSGEPEAAVEA